MSALDEATIEAIRGLQKIIGDGNAERGFHEEGDNLRLQHSLHHGTESALRNYYAMRLGLIVSEASEALEELRDGREVGELYYSGGAPGPIGIFEDESIDYHDQLRKPEGVPSEVADIVIRCFDFFAEAGIDGAEVIAKKLAYNATRGRMHGGRKF